MTAVSHAGAVQHVAVAVTYVAEYPVAHAYPSAEAMIGAPAAAGYSRLCQYPGSYVGL